MKPIVLACLLLLPVPALAQGPPVVAPNVATFTHPDVGGFAVTVSYKFDLFRCASLNNGACVGRDPQPFQPSSFVAKSIVTGPEAARTFRFDQLAVNPIPLLPAGVPFVSTLIAVGDPNNGGIESPRSADSNAFFGSGLAPVSPGAPAVSR